MAVTEADGIKISEFPSAPEISSSDLVTGLHDGDNANFTFSRIMAWFRDAVTAFFVPNSRKVNGKALSSDISLNASDVGARAADWMPTAAQVGARPDTWTPSAQDVGAVPVAAVGVAGGVPNLDEIGRVPQNQLPPYPTVPAASTANPQMDGTASPGSTGEWADGGHVHPTDTTRAAAALEINGHPLTGDFDLTAADVGALSSGGTAVAASRLNWSHKTSEPQGWHKVLTIPFAGGTLRRKFVVIVEASGSGTVGILRCNWYCANPTTYTIAASWLSVGTAGWADAATARDGTNISLYINKTAASGQMVITVLESTNQNGNDIYMPQYFADTTADADFVSELPAGAVIAAGPTAELDGAGNNISEGKLWFDSVPVSSGANQVVSTISDSRITADYALARIEFADPSLIMAGYSWATGAGNFTLTGSVFAATTANILLIRRGN